MAAHHRKIEASSVASSAPPKGKGKQPETVRDGLDGDAGASMRRMSYEGKGKRPARAGSFSAGGAGPSRRSPDGTWRSTGWLAKSRPPARELQKNLRSERVAEERVVDEPDPVCDFCPIVNRTGGTLPSAMLGPFNKGKMRKSVHVHAVCAMWIPEAYHDPETDELHNVISAHQRSRRLTCSVCGNKGASVGCYVPECPRVYHFCCFYASPHPSTDHPENDGPCFRHDDYHAAFCPAHTARATEEVFMQQMTADAAQSRFLWERAAAVESALDGHPQQGTDCPNYVITGLRRNEKTTIFRHAWGVASEAAESAWVSLATRPHRRVLRRGEPLVPLKHPRRIARAALAVALCAILAADGRPAAAAVQKSSAGHACGAQDPGNDPTCGGDGRANVAVGGAAAVDESDGNGSPHRRSPVFLLRNLRRYHGSPLRRLLPAVPLSFLSTPVVARSPMRPRSLPTGTSSGGMTCGGDPAEAGGGGAARTGGSWGGGAASDGFARRSMAGRRRSATGATPFLNFGVWPRPCPVLNFGTWVRPGTAPEEREDEDEERVQE